MSKTINTCYSCRFWHGEGVRERGPRGDCHRMPPTVSDRFPDGRHPRPLSTNWCGEWQAHPVQRRDEPDEQSPGWQPISAPTADDAVLERAITAYRQKFPHASVQQARAAVEKIRAKQAARPGRDTDDGDDDSKPR
jgi:hypothetical protein